MPGRFILFFACLLLPAGISAQVSDPASWRYEVRKTAVGEHELVFRLELKQGWHIWSQDPGGDGFQIIPSFDFDRNDIIELNGKTSEHGELHTDTMEGIDGAVNYYSGEVEYVQKVTVKGKGTVTGTHEYQVCNDQMCLPPKRVKFAFEVAPSL